jgi:hypothetical protein
MKSFDPAKSRVVLVGTPAYSDPDLPDVPVITRNISDLEAVFTDPELGGFDPVHCVVVPADATVAQIGNVLVDAAAEAEDLLLFYYCGHGLVSSQTFELYLSVAETRHNRPQFSALSFAAVREAFLDSSAATRVVILDSCFSGKAIGQPLAGEDAVVLGQVDVEGSYTLTAAPSNRTALVRPGEAHTAFTERLLRLLRAGSPRAGQWLTLNEIYRGLRSSLLAEGLPQPQQRGVGNAGQLGLVPNRAYSPATARDDLDGRVEGANSLAQDGGGDLATAPQVPYPRLVIPAGAPVAAATWTASGPEVFILRDGHIWCSHHPGDPDGGWSAWSELPYTGNRRPFTAIAAHSDPRAAERNAVIGLIGTTPHVNDAKGLWGAMSRPGGGKFHDMRLTDAAIVLSRWGVGGAAFVVEAQGHVWEWDDTDWFSSETWEEISTGERPHIGTIAASAIAVCSDGEGLTALFAVAAGRVHYYRKGNLTGDYRIDMAAYFDPWEDLEIPATPIVDVACWSLGAHHVEVFALDADGRIWHTETSNNCATWTGWNPVSPTPGETRAISVTSRHDTSKQPSLGKGMLIAITADGSIYEGQKNPSVPHDPDWPVWSPLPSLHHN